MFRQATNGLLYSLTICTLLSCNSQEVKQPVQKEEVQKAEIFPVKSYFEEQLHLVDSLKLPVVKYTTVDRKTDTSLITTSEFTALAKEFMEPDITSPSLSHFYKETGFADQSIPNVTFTYSTLKKDLEIQRMDVVIQPNPVLDDKVKSVYLEKTGVSKDTSILKKMYWKSNKFFQIITFKQSGSASSIVSQVKVAWDDYEE